MSIKAIVFNQNGALMDIGKFWGKVYLNTAKELECGEKLSEMMEACGFTDSGKYITGRTSIHSTIDDIAKKWESILDNKTDASYIKSTLKDNLKYGEVLETSNLKRVLDSLKKRNIKIGIATNNEYDVAKFILDKLQISSYVDALVTSDMVNRPKPSSDMMNKLSEIWKIPKYDIMTVGVSNLDISFSKNSGTVGVYYTKDIYETVPDDEIEVINSLNEIINLINEKNSIPV